MNIGSDNNLLCPNCESEYNHLIGTIMINDDDTYVAKKFIITLSGKTYEINCNVHYPFRSQGNIHMLFQCESGHYHIVSYDGHKGFMFVDRNETLDKLSLYLNDALSSMSVDGPLLRHFSDFKILSLIEDFLDEFTE